MTNRVETGNTSGRNASRGHMLAVVAILAALFAFPAVTSAAGPLAVPATFIRYVETPGTADSILRPTAMRWDPWHDEMLVVDSGHNRILVFNANGAYRFEFDLGQIVTAASDVAAGPDGFIYVLGSIPGGRVLHRFDFDGLSLGPVALPAELNGAAVDPRNVVCGPAGLLYVLDNGGKRILVLAPESGLVRSFGLGLADRSEDEVFGLGRLALAGDELLVPVSTEGTVLRYGLDGADRGRIGHFGAKPGSLNFPVAVDRTPEGTTVVLDQTRFCVVCYGPDGQVLGEFGGRGKSPGWFINPSLLAAPAADRVFVGQIFRNRIQVCAIPDFARGRSREDASQDHAAVHPSSTLRASDNCHTSYPFARSYTFALLERGPASPQRPVQLSHLEVSE